MEVVKMVRAKFKVETKLENEYGFEINLKPVIGGSEENEKFYNYTPAGSVNL